MDIQKLINDYTDWLNREITFEKIGQYYEITTPFLDEANDYMQFYVKLEDDTISFSDDGYTINRLIMNGLQLKGEKKKELTRILKTFGVSLEGEAIVSSANEKNFPQKKHMFIQALIRVDDLFSNIHTKTKSTFNEDVINFFSKKEIYYSDNVQFTGKSGFAHNYEFLFQRSKNQPERLCRLVNNPNKSNMENILFAWYDTKEERRNDSKLIVVLNDLNPIAKGVEEGFLNYDARVVKWSEKNKAEIVNTFLA